MIKTGITAWSSPSNLALIKYWGKKDFQIPINPSLSLSLAESVTVTEVEWNYDTSRNKLEFEFLFEDKPKPVFKLKLEQYFNQLIKNCNWLQNVSLKIKSRNTFPHSVGIASSASGISALALCLVSIEQSILDTTIGEKDFFKRVSELARLGSGSASRSVFPYAAFWGRTPLVEGSSNEFAIHYENGMHDDLKSIKDYIFIVKYDEKSVSSSAGHQLMNEHNYRDGRIKQANKNIEKIIPALKEANWKLLAEVCEEEALSLHALMMSSDPSYLLLEPESLKIIKMVKLWREKYNAPIFFSIDAGPNIHVLFPSRIKDDVKEWIKQDLNEFNETDRIIFDRIGSGPQKLV